MIDIEPSTLRILNAKGQTIGSGFLVSKTLAVTCAHVAMAASPDSETRIRVQFTGQKQAIAARILDQFLDLERDVAILELASAPEGVQPLRLGLAAQCQPGNPFYSFGYTSAANIQGIIARGAIDGYLPQHKLLQLQAPQADHGISGAPVLDEKRGVVVGMITKGHTELGRNQETTFATPAELLFEICPEIQPSEICPYLGLESFTAETERFFFGRAALTEKLLTTLRGGCRFLAVFGPSGSGKSSVVRAGLLPALAKGQLPGSQQWAQVTIRPADDPFAQMKALGLGLRDIDGYLRRHPGMERLLLFVDQFEELFSLCPDELRDGFVRDLAAALESSRLILILSMRDDFYSAFNAKAAPLAASTDKVVVDVPVTLERADLVAMIQQPAAAVGLALEEGLTDAIIKDATTDGAARSSTLPLLEFALTQLWDKRRDGLLTHDAYQTIGGVTGSLALWAEKAYSDLSKADQLLAESLLTALVHLGDESQGLPDTRRRRALIEFDEPTRRAIKHFADRRLLITGGETVELVHDALLREWIRLQRWLGDNRRFLVWQQRVAEKYTEWQEGKGELLHRRELAEAQGFLKEHWDIPKELLAYIRKSMWNQARQRNLIFGIVSAVLVIFASLAFWGQKNANEARAQAIIARAGGSAAQSILLRNQNFSLSILLGLEAFESKDISQSRSAILDNTRTNPWLRQFLNGHTDTISEVAFTPDGKILASASADKTIILWDVATGKPIGQPLNGHTDAVLSVAFSPDGKMLASGSYDKTIILWDVVTGKPIRQPLIGHTHLVESVTFSPDGKTLASGSNDNTIILWNITTGKPIGQPLIGHADSVESVVFSPDGKTLASGSDDKTIILWNTATEKPIGQPLIGHTDSVESVAFSHDGKVLASGSDDKTIILWDVATGKPIDQPLIGHTNWVSSVTFSPDDKTLASGSFDKTIILWDVEMGKPIGQPLTGHTNWIYSVAFSPDGKTLASSSDDKTIILWNTSTSKQIGQPLSGHTAWVTSVAFSPDGKVLASGSVDNTIILWDVATGKPIDKPLIGHANSIFSVAFSPDGKTLASGSPDKTIILWNTATAKPIDQPLSGHTDWVLSVAFSPDGKILASGSGDKTIILWNVATGKPMSQSLVGHTNSVSSVAFSPDGKTLASASFDKTIILWDIATGKPIHKLSGHTNWIYSVAFSPDGKTLASGSADKTIIFWDTTTGKPIGQPLTSHTALIYNLAFSPDGKTLASASFDKTIILWNTATGKPISQLTRHTDWVSSVAFSPDGKTLASGSYDKTIILWNLDPQSWVDETCQRAGRNFTRAEWERYFPGDEYRATCSQWPLEPEPTPIHPTP